MKWKYQIFASNKKGSFEEELSHCIFQLREFGKNTPSFAIARLDIFIGSQTKEEFLSKKKPSLKPLEPSLASSLFMK